MEVLGLFLVRFYGVVVYYIRFCFRLDRIRIILIVLTIDFHSFLRRERCNLVPLRRHIALRSLWLFHNDLHLAGPTARAFDGCYMLRRSKLRIHFSKFLESCFGSCFFLGKLLLPAELCLISMQFLLSVSLALFDPLPLPLALILLLFFKKHLRLLLLQPLLGLALLATFLDTFDNAKLVKVAVMGADLFKLLALFLILKAILFALLLVELFLLLTHLAPLALHHAHYSLGVQPGVLLFERAAGPLTEENKRT